LRGPTKHGTGPTAVDACSAVPMCLHRSRRYRQSSHVQSTAAEPRMVTRYSPSATVPEPTTDTRSSAGCA
jgi:hypothetical protein